MADPLRFVDPVRQLDQLMEAVDGFGLIKRSHFWMKYSAMVRQHGDPVELGEIEGIRVAHVQDWVVRLAHEYQVNLTGRPE